VDATVIALLMLLRVLQEGVGLHSPIRIRILPSWAVIICVGSTHCEAGNFLLSPVCMDPRLVSRTTAPVALGRCLRATVNRSYYPVSAELLPSCCTTIQECGGSHHFAIFFDGALPMPWKMDCWRTG